LEILAAIKHSDLANDLKIDTKNLKGEDLKNAYEKEINHYAGSNRFYFKIYLFKNMLSGLNFFLKK